MFRFSDLSIQRKLILLAASTSLVALVLAGGAFTLYEVLSFRRDTAREMDILAGIIGTNSTAALVFEDSGAARETLQALSVEPHVKMGAIYGRFGRLFAYYLRSDTPATRVEAVVPPLGAHFTRTELWLARPIFLDGETLGTVLVVSDLQAMYARLERYAILALIVLAVSSVLALLLASRLQLLISRPVERLVRAARNVKDEQDYSVRVERDSSDELGLLIDGFNEMLQQIQDRDHQLETHREQLEEQVEARTKELSTLNAELSGAKERAEEGSRAKSLFLAKVSHELRTPMNAIMGMTDLLLMSPLAPDQKKLARNVAGSADLLLALINDILDFERLEAEKLTLQSVDLDLCEIIDEAVGLVALRAEEEGLDLVSRVDPEIPRHLLGDPGRVRQVLVNLLSNAVKFTSKGGASIRAELVDRHPTLATVRICVEDTGIGISEEDRDTIFDSFSQVDGSLSRRYGGTGLGLAICKQLVTLMKGEIDLTSTPGVGSTFWLEVTFPCSESEETLLTLPSDLQDTVTGVALVVHSPLTARCLEETLQSWGLRVSLWESVERAAAGLREGAAQGGGPLSHMVLDERTLALGSRGARESFSAWVRGQGLRTVLLTSLGSPAATGPAGLEEAVPVSRPVGGRDLLDVLLGRATRASDGDRGSVASRSWMARGLGLGPHGPESSPRTPRPGESTETGMRGVHVLLAEDNVLNQEVEIRQLETLGLRVSLARDGVEALEAMEQGSFDLVFMDCQMPRLNGYDATREQRRRESEEGRPRTPIVALTAHALPEEREASRAAGMDDYLTKPVRLSDLKAMLERWIGWMPIVSEKGAEDPAAGDESPVDVSRVLQVVGGNPDSFTMLMNIFMEKTGEQLAQLDEAITDEDHEKVVFISHSCAGSSAAYGMVGLYPLFREIEQRGKEHDNDGERRVYSYIRAELERIAQFLEDRKESLPE